MSISSDFLFSQVIRLLVSRLSSRTWFSLKITATPINSIHPSVQHKGRHWLQQQQRLSVFFRCRIRAYMTSRMTGCYSSHVATSVVSIGKNGRFNETHHVTPANRGSGDRSNLPQRRGRGRGRE